MKVRSYNVIHVLGFVITIILVVATNLTDYLFSMSEHRKGKSTTEMLCDLNFINYSIVNCLLQLPSSCFVEHSRCYSKEQRLAA